MNNFWIAWAIFTASIFMSGSISNVAKAIDKHTEQCATKGGAA